MAEYWIKYRQKNYYVYTSFAAQGQVSLCCRIARSEPSAGSSIRSIQVLSVSLLQSFPLERRSTASRRSAAYGVSLDDAFEVRETLSMRKSKRRKVPKTKEKNDIQTPVICLACAHPAKFGDAIRKALGYEPELPDELSKLTNLETCSKTVAAHPETIKQVVLETLEARS